MHREVSDGELSVVVVPDVVALQALIVLAVGGGGGERADAGRGGREKKREGVWSSWLLTMVGTVKS